jgi:hypothetical protein
MTVSKNTRDDYEEGKHDAGKGAFDRVVTDVTGNHPGTDAYYKGRDGKQLDGDKKDKD